MERQFWEDGVLLEIAGLHLIGSALGWYKYYRSDIKNWNDFKGRFRKKYADRRSTAEKFVDMMGLIQKVSELVEEYFYLKRRMCKELCLSFKECKELVLREDGLVKLPLMGKHNNVEQLLEGILKYEQLTRNRRRMMLKEGRVKKSTTIT